MYRALYRPHRVPLILQGLKTPPVTIQKEEFHSFGKKMCILANVDELCHEPIIAASGKAIDLFGSQIAAILIEEFQKRDIDLIAVSNPTLQTEHCIETIQDRGDMWSSFQDILEYLKKRISHFLYGEMEPKKKEAPTLSNEGANPLFVIANTTGAIVMTYILYKFFVPVPKL